MGLKQLIKSILKKLPVIGPLKEELARQKMLNANSEKHILNMMEQRRGLNEKIEGLEGRLSEAEADKENAEVKARDLGMNCEALKNTERLHKEDMANLNRNMAEKHEELRETEKELAFMKEHAKYRLDQHEDHKAKYQELKKKYTDAQKKMEQLEAKVEEARKGFAIFETFKKFTQKEYWALDAKHKKLELEHEVINALLGQDRQHLARALRSVDRLKSHVRFAFDAAKEYKYGANEYAMDMLAKTLERAGISALIFDEENIIYSTSYVAETIELEDDLVGACFADVFESDSLEAFSELGPQHPLTTKKGKQFAGILFSFVTGHDKDTGERKHYRTIWLIGDRKIGLSEYFRGNEVAMPRNITAEYAKRVVGGHLNDRLGKFGKSTKLAINCDSSHSIDMDAAEYLTRVVASNVDREIEIRNPCKSIYDTLIIAQFPEDQIKGYSPKKKEKDIQIGSKTFGINFVPA